jgi:hypothetical protein
METQVLKIKISPEFLLTNKTEIQVSGETYGVYSGMTQMLRGGPNQTSLFTGFTFPILLTQTTIDVGYFSVFDGAISQINVVSNFIFSSTTGNPYTWYIYNTSDAEFKSFLNLSTYRVDWGDGSPLESITGYSPNSIVHNYPNNPSGYTITLKQINPWGNTTVVKQIQTPYQLVPILDPTGEAFFTPMVGSWTGTPISYNYIFSGDAVNTVANQVTSAYIPVPFTVSGVTTSRIRELFIYGPPPNYRLNTPVIQNGDIFGIITDMNAVFTAYTIQDINFVDYSDNTTLYFLGSSGLTENHLVADPLVKDELLLGIVSEPEVQSDIFIDRGKNSALERIQRLGEVDSLRDLTTYGYGFFDVT